MRENLLGLFDSDSIIRCDILFIALNRSTSASFYAPESTFLQVGISYTLVTVPST